MTKQELNEIFQRVNSELIAENYPQKVRTAMEKSTQPLAVLPVEMMKLNQEFLFRVLSKALCTD